MSTRRFPSSHGPALAVLAAVLAIAIPPASAEVVDFESERWTIEQGEIVTYLDQKALRGGRASLKDVDFANGIIEFDVAVDGSRGFPSVQFRVKSDDDFESFYIRPHKSGQPDALQYTPVFNGNGCWQLYNGRGFTAAADIPTDRWIHVKLEVSGARGRVYFHSMERPALVIDDLKYGDGAGWLMLVAPPGNAVHFANFAYQQVEAIDLGPVPKRAPLPGRIATWQLSQQLGPDQINRFRPPAEQELGAIEWRGVEADDQGLLDITRHVDKPRNSAAVILAKTTIHSDAAEVKRLTFGYSDLVSVFLDGRLLFSGDSSFLRRDEMFAGTVGLNDDLYLPLKQGDNELLFVLTDSFGGWGLVAQLRPVPTETVVLAPQVVRKWEIAEGLRNPETVLFDSKREVLYVSNVNFTAGGGEPVGFVSKVRLDGTMESLEWVTGLARPTGMALVGDRLFVVERPGLAEIDVDSGSVVARHPIASEGMLNDIAAAPEGTLYVSDSRADVVFRVRAGEAEKWLVGPELEAPNGLLVDGGRLVIGNLRGGTVLFVDLESGKIEEIIELPGLIDAVEADGKGNLIVSHYEGRALLVSPSGESLALLDTTEAGLSCANLGFEATSRLLGVPMLLENRVVVYEVGEIGP